MTITFVLAWWHIPAAVTLALFLWALFWPIDDGGYMGGISRLFMLLPAALISAVAWAIAGALK